MRLFSVDIKIAAVWVALGGVAIWAAKAFIQEGIKRLGQDVWPAVLKSRWRSMGRRNLKRYRASLIVNYNTNALGFLQGTSIRVTDVYVPLQFVHNGRREDIYESIRRQTRTVILGAAGAGKSMLLKNSMVRWATEPLEFQRTPVLVELIRCNNGGETLFDLVADALTRNGVRSPHRFLEGALNSDRFSVFFDGLDEVITDKRAEVVHQIERFAERFPPCQIVVTSRDAVYDGDLRPVFLHEVRIAEFDDAATRRFLRRWLGRHHGEDRVRHEVEQLMASLRDSAPLHRIAQSPLMLTIIAALHDADPGVGGSLSSSRAEFYETAVRHLLRRDLDLGRQGPIAVYKAGHKYMALRKVAFAAQGAIGKGTDRRAIPESELLTHITAAVNSFNLESRHARPMMDEIVDRSGLLVRIDEANLLYEFPHLTLQEYLAAMELADHPDRLLELYLENPQRWRETVKLWCGGANRDSTELIRAIFTGNVADRVLALECVAEARQLDEALATLVLNYFEAQLGRDDQYVHLVVRALGACAQDPGQRGRRLLERLSLLARAIFEAADDEELAGYLRLRDNAIDAIAASRVRPALEILADLALTNVRAREALWSMGDLAVPVLGDRAHDGFVGAVDDLAAVGTVSAAAALVPLLWQPNRDTAVRAAWRLAELLGQNPDVEEELKAIDLTSTMKNGSHLWLWEPFAPDNMASRVIIGRVAQLLDTSRLADVPRDLEAIDPRIAIPLGVVDVGLLSAAEKDLEQEVAALAKAQGISYPATTVWPQSTPRTAVYLRIMAQRNVTEALPVARKIFRMRGVPAIKHRMLVTLPAPIVVWIASFFWSTWFRATKDDWRGLKDTPTDPQWARRVLAGGVWALVIVAVGLGLVRVAGTLFGFWPLGPVWLSVAILLLGVTGIVAAMIGVLLEDRNANADGSFAVAAFGFLFFAGVLGALVVWSVETALGPVFGILVFAVAAAWLVLWRWLERRHSRFTINPFRMLLTLDRHIVSSRATVIAPIPTESGKP